ncbi:hypothetical protein J6590_083178 [Homalodisca vitripennis]|nr:hypothetical protein J6590_083178 [Homalodisca vitripennis]
MLAASSTVSGGWRGCFNHKWMWWQHCNADTAEYLEAAECRVEPRFESLESEDSTLTCLYKKQRLQPLVWAGEVPSTRTGCGSNTVTRKRLNTWRLRNVGWIRVLNPRSR